MLRRTRTAFACAVSAVGLLAFAAPAPAAAPVSATMSGLIVFQAVLIPNPSLIKDPSCPFIGLNMGSGTLKPFGHVSFSSTECVKPNAVWTVLEASKGRMLLTTANGDIINGTYGGTFTLDAGNYVANAMPFDIVGGTGAYVRAHGSGTLNISQSAATGTGSIAPTGVVTY
jgi:hypothetical protein